MPRNVVQSEGALPEPTDAEKAAIRAAEERRSQRPARAAVKILSAQPGQMVIANSHSDSKGWASMFQDACGTSSEAFSNEVFSRVELMCRKRPQELASEAEINAALALLGAVAPEDELEAALGEQIVATHLLSMQLMGKANNTDTLEKLQVYTTLATKVSRTMAAHVETLTRLRSGGKQTHEIRYVYINGDAVVGDHAQAVFGGMGGGANAQNCGRPHAPGDFTHQQVADGAALLGHHTPRNALPVSESPGSCEVSDARRGERVGGAARAAERPLHMRSLDEGAARSARPRASGAQSQRGDR